MNGTVLRDAAIFTGLALVVAFAFNASRPSGLPLVASRPYAIHVPCADTKGEVESVDANDPRLGETGVLFLDARSAEEFAADHREGAINVPYDYFKPVAGDSVRRLAASGARRIAVYGDGEDPDSGRELAGELAAKGIQNMLHVKGGAAALGVSP